MKRFSSTLTARWSCSKTSPTSRDKLHHELDDMSASRETRDDSQGPETTGDDRERQTHSRGGTQLYDAIYLASDQLMKNQRA